MRFLVTGGAGFIGSNIVKRLLEDGHQVRVLDNFSTAQRTNLTPFGDSVELIEGDVRDFWTVIKATKGIDYIIHQAALPSIPRSIDNPLTTTEVNINGTLNVLEAARLSDVQRIVFASSSSVYGNSRAAPNEESMKPSPQSPYAITKLAAEEYCLVFYRLYNLETVALRYFNVFGPNQNPHSPYAAVIPKFITMMRGGQRPVIYGDGTTARDFTYVDNVVEATLAACQKKEAAGEVINVATGQAHTLDELVQTLNRILDTNLAPIYAPAKPADIKHSQADISKARRLLGYEPKVDFEEGLKRTLHWLTGRS